VFVIDSKQWNGSVHQGTDGLVWHNHHRLDRTLETVRWEARVISRVLGTRPAALLCVHGAHVHGGDLHAQGVAIIPAHLLRIALGYDRALSDPDVEQLATTAWTSLRPAACHASRQRHRTAAGGLSSGRTAALTACSLMPIRGGRSNHPAYAGKDGSARRQYRLLLGVSTHDGRPCRRPSLLLQAASGPQVMATLRNVGIGRLRLAGHTQIAPTLRWVDRNPARALAFLRLP
jgi:hypothetical protein